MDGIRGEKEWSGSIQLAYNNETSKANDGKIYLALPQTRISLPSSGTVGTATDAVLFFENFPVDTRATPDEFGVVRIYMDFDRFNGPDDFIGLKDRLFEFDIVNGVPLQNFRGTSTQSWQKSAQLGISVATATSNCKPDPSTNTLLRCNAEVRITLDPSALAKPDPASSVLPGFGLAITDGQKKPSPGKINSYPSGQSEFFLDSEGRPIERTRWETILIGRPKGFPLKFMSWNVRRFKSSSLKGDFDKVSNVEIGRFLALNDVVAIQEGWDTPSVMEIWEQANIERASKGLPLFRKPYTPPQVVALDKKGFLEDLGAQIQGEPESHGGLWIFSHLPAMRTGQLVFDLEGKEPGLLCEGLECKPYCKGEDCLKAKGAQWVRLNLNPSDGPAADCNLTPKPPEGHSDEVPASCPYSPSGDHYIDIFNTHLQASNTKFCEYGVDTAKDILVGLTAVAASGGTFGWLKLAKELIEDDFYCSIPDATVRQQQLRQLNRFIEDTAQERDRPAVIMGDFNLDGRDTSDGEYASMMNTLRIGPGSASGNQPTDIINPWRFDFGDDYDHGDVARERSDFNFNGPIGTFITEDGGTFVGGSSLANDVGRVNGNERYDFILIRPPYRPDSSEFKQARWVALKPKENREVWSSPWPGQKDPIIDPSVAPPPPPERFSDHKPVVSTIELTPLAQPPTYHPTWKHNWEYRVTSANASGIPDCVNGFNWLSDDCENVDLYNRLYSATVVATGAGLNFQWGAEKNSLNFGKYGYCDEQSNVHWSSDQCTHEWFIAGKHTSTSQISHDGSSSLLDNEINDDEMLVLPRKNDHARLPWIKTIWDSPLVQNRAQIEFFMADSNVDPSQWERWFDTFFPEDSAPIGQCTPFGIPSVCVETRFEELPPGEQF